MMQSGHFSCSPVAIEVHSKVLCTFAALLKRELLQLSVVVERVWVSRLYFCNCLQVSSKKSTYLNLVAAAQLGILPVLLEDSDNAARISFSGVVVALQPLKSIREGTLWNSIHLG